MRRARGKIETIGLEGWIRIPPGGIISIFDDFAPRPTQEQQVERMRSIRGWILGAGFGIDNELVNIKLLNEFSTLDPSIGGSTFVERQEKFRSNVQLGRLIDDCKPILRRMLAREVADRLLQGLADYRRLRNLMAHRTSWLEGDYDPTAGTDPEYPKGRTTAFRLWIGDADFVWEIDNAQIDEWSDLLARCEAGVTQVRSSLMPTPVSASSSPPSP